MALPATDSFVTDSSVALDTYSASWTVNTGAFLVDGLTDAVLPNDAGFSLAHWNADTFNDNQYAETTQNFTAFVYLGPAVRVASGTTVTGYFYIADDSDGRYLGKRVSGTNTYIGSTLNDALDGDVLRIEASGTTITPKRNGATDSDIGAQTDSAISSGSAGIAGLVNGSLTHATDWEGGNLSAPSSSLTVAEASHTHTADALALAQKHTLTTAEASHSHTADALTLAQDQGALTVSDATHGHTTDGALALAQKHTLTIADATHGHTVENTGVAAVLEISEASHSHTADGTLTFAQVHTLTIQDAIHGHRVDIMGAATGRRRRRRGLLLPI